MQINLHVIPRAICIYNNSGLQTLKVNSKYFRPGGQTVTIQQRLTTSVGKLQMVLFVTAISNHHYRKIPYGITPCCMSCGFQFRILSKIWNLFHTEGNFRLENQRLFFAEMSFSLNPTEDETPYLPIAIKGHQFAWHHHSPLYYGKKAFHAWLQMIIFQANVTLLTLRKTLRSCELTDSSEYEAQHGCMQCFTSSLHSNFHSMKYIQQNNTMTEMWYLHGPPIIGLTNILCWAIIGRWACIATTDGALITGIPGGMTTLTGVGGGGSGGIFLCIGGLVTGAGALGFGGGRGGLGASPFCSCTFLGPILSFSSSGL